MSETSSHSFLKNVFKLGSAAVISQSLGIVAAPIFARLFSPDQVGVFNLWLSLTALLGTLSTCRYELGVVLPKEGSEAINILAGGLGIAVIWSALLGMGFIAGVQALFSESRYVAILPFLWLAPLYIFIRGASRVFEYWFNRNQLFGVNASLQLIKSVLTRVGNIGGGFIGFQTGAYLIWVGFFVLLIEFIAKICIFSKTSYEQLKNISLPSIIGALVRYKKFPMIDIWGAFLNNFSIQLAPLMIAYFFTPTEVGFYSQGMRLIQLPLFLIGVAVSQVYFQKAADLYHQGRLGELLSQVQGSLFALGAFPFIVLGLFGKELFGFFLGARWEEAGIYAQLMAPWCFFVFCGSPVSTTIIVLEKQGSYLIFNLLTVSFRFVALYIGAQLMSCRIAILLYSLSGVLLWMGFLSFLFSKSKLSILKTWKRNGLTVLPAVLAAFPLVLIKIYSSSLILQGAGIGIITICFLIYSLRYSKEGVWLKNFIAAKYSRKGKSSDAV